MEDALKYASEETKTMLLDSLSCLCHNEGHSLNGNDQHFDEEWLAREIWFKLENAGHINHWDKIPPQVRDHYLRIARASLMGLERLMGRISRRYLAWESALRAQWQICRARKIAQRNMYVEKINQNEIQAD
ncbi:MAG: hypothetical protein M1608_13445 [Candidatus Omnitrophica bacterium]|nr:hypothetical protein [Candidatus Omnitrophota bacterium]